MPDGYHRLNPVIMEQRDNVIIHLVRLGLRHKLIANQVRMAPSGVETRLQKLRLEGKLAPGRGRNG